MVINSLLRDSRNLKEAIKTQPKWNKKGQSEDKKRKKKRKKFKETNPWAKKKKFTGYL